MLGRSSLVYSRSVSAPVALCDDDAVKNELKRHQGTWIATSSTFDGQKAPDEIARSIRRIVAQDHVVWERQGKRFAGTKIKSIPQPIRKTSM